MNAPVWELVTVFTVDSVDAASLRVRVSCRQESAHAFIKGAYRVEIATADPGLDLCLYEARGLSYEGAHRLALERLLLSIC